MPTRIDGARQRVLDRAWDWRVATYDGPTPRNPQLRELAAAVDELRDARSQAAIQAVQARQRPTAWARVLEPAF